MYKLWSIISLNLDFYSKYQIVLLKCYDMKFDHHNLKIQFNDPSNIVLVAKPLKAAIAIAKAIP